MTKMEGGHLKSKASMNGSTGLKTGSSRLREPDPLDEMRAAIEDGREATKLLAYSEDFEEDTARHEVTVNLTAPTAPQPSQPQIEVSQPSPGVFNIAITAVKQLSGWSLAAVLIVAILAYAWLRSIGAVK